MDKPNSPTDKPNTPMDKFVSEVENLDRFLQENKSIDHVPLIPSVSITDFVGLSHEIIQRGFPRIHNRAGYSLMHLYQALYPIMSVQLSPYMKAVINAWLAWTENDE